MRGLACVGLLLGAATAWTGGVGSLEGKILMVPPKIDGTIDPLEWKDASTFRGLLDANTGTAQEEDGEFWLAYDAQFVYFAARLKDRTPGKIQATEYRSNVGLGGNDSVTLQLDLFGNLSDFNSFSINPRGATSLQIAGGRAAKREWLGDFVGAGRITPEGWEAEARIPWSVMRLPGKGRHEVRFNVLRAHRRLQRMLSWAFVNGGQVENYGRWLNVELPEPAPRTLKALPYLYAGYDEREKEVVNAGVDYRTELTDTLDLVGSLNPDFRNIENQVLSLDFSYFERLAGETRPFFLEGGQFFRTSFDAPVFASQRIRGFDLGTKVFGKLDPDTDFGLLNAIDFTHENQVVTKVRRQVAKRTSLEAAYVGYDGRNAKNDATFFAGWHSVGPYSFFGQYSTTRDSDPGFGTRTNLGATFGENGFRWDVEYLRISPEYFPRLGYAPERGFVGAGGGLGLTRPTRRFGLVETGWGLSFGSFTRIDGSPYRERLGADASITWRDGTDLDLYAEAENFYPFRDRVIGFSLERPRGDNYRRWQVNGSWGELAGSPYRNLMVSGAYRPINPLQLSGSVQMVEVERKQFEQAIFGINYDLGQDQSISGRLVARDGKSNGYLAFRRSGNRGAEYFLILGDPNAETFRFSLILKAVFPLELRF